MRDGTQARDALHHRADRPAELALDANAVCGHGRFAAGQKCADDLKELRLVDRAAVQLKIHRHVAGNRGRGRQRLDIGGHGVHGGDEFAYVRKVAQRLNAASRRTCADGDQVLGLPANFTDALRVAHRGDGSFHQRQVEGTVFDRARGFGELGDLHRVGERQKLILAVEQRELTAVARGELPDREPRCLRLGM